MSKSVSHRLEFISILEVSFDGGEFICTLHERLSDNQALDSVNSPDGAIRLIDRLVTEEPGTGEPSMLKDKHFVVTALVIDPSTRTVEGSVLGAPPVYIKEPSGEVQVINEPGTPIGLLPVDEVQVTRFDNLEPGTEIIVMTDGLTELPLRGIPESSGITPLVVDLLEKDPSLLFSSDLDEQAALSNLVQRAKENAGDDWGLKTAQ
jgi:serine phosphatase RsbU (regulator of sigma subunit)